MWIPYIIKTKSSTGISNIHLKSHLSRFHFHQQTQFYTNTRNPIYFLLIFQSTNPVSCSDVKDLYHEEKLLHRIWMIHFKFHPPRFCSRKRCAASSMATTSRRPSLRSRTMGMSCMLLVLTNLQLTLSQLTSNPDPSPGTGQEEEAFDHVGYGWPIRVVIGAKELSGKARYIRL